MSTYYEQLQSAIDALEGQEGEALLRGIRGVIELAKQNNDGDTVADFSRHLIEAGSRSGRLDYEMIGFGEMQALFERSGKHADLRDYVLWYYKWLAERLPEYVEVPRDQIEAFFQRMEAFYEAQDEGKRPVWELRCRAASFMGHEQEAAGYAELWEKTEKRGSDNCPACETHSRVQYLLDVGKLPEALAAAGPILAGEQYCEEVPSTTFSRLLLPLLFTGEGERALTLAFITRGQARHTPALLSHLADHVIFLSMVGLWEQARRHLWLMLSRVMDANNAFVRYCVYRAAWLCLARMGRVGIETITFPPRTELAGQRMTTPAAAARFEAAARDIAKAFDRRNGTERFAKRLETVERLIELRPREE